MMKSLLFKTLAIITGMMMSFTLVSCGDDDGNESDAPIAVAYYYVSYATELDEDWFRFFDVSVTYVNKEGEEASQTIGANIDVPVRIEADMAPDVIGFRIHVSRKSAIPTVDANQPYHFNGSATFYIQAYLNDGAKGVSYGNFIPEGIGGTTIGGKDMERFLEKYKDADIFVRSFEIKQ